MRTKLLFRGTHLIAAALALTLGLASTGCGGGGKKASAPVQPPAILAVPEGAWEGSITDPSGQVQKARALVLADGEATLSTDGGLAMSISLDQGTGVGTVHAVGPKPLTEGATPVTARGIRRTSLWPSWAMAR